MKQCISDLISFPQITYIHSFLVLNMVRLKHRYIVGQMLLDPSYTALSSSSSPSSSSKSASVDIINNITSRELNSAVLETIQRLYGDVGTGSFGMGTTGVRYIDPVSKIYVIRTSREDLEQVQFALTCMNQVKKGGGTSNSNSNSAVNNIVLRTLDIAGSMRTCKEKLIHYLRTYAEVFALGQPSIDNYIALVDRLEA